MIILFLPVVVTPTLCTLSVTELEILQFHASSWILNPLGQSCKAPFCPLDGEICLLVLTHGIHCVPQPSLQIINDNIYKYIYINYNDRKEGKTTSKTTRAAQQWQWRKRNVHHPEVTQTNKTNPKETTIRTTISVQLQMFMPTSCFCSTSGTFSFSALYRYSHCVLLITKSDFENHFVIKGLKALLKH